MRTALIALLALAATTAHAEPRSKRPTDEERGNELYTRHCESCHGTWNKGHGPATRALVQPVPDLEGKVSTDDETIELVLRGKNAMPGFEQAFDRFDARRVLDWMAKLTPPDPNAPTDGDDPAKPSEDAEEADPTEEPTEPPAVEQDEEGPE